MGMMLRRHKTASTKVEPPKPVEAKEVTTTKKAVEKKTQTKR